MEFEVENNKDLVMFFENIEQYASFIDEFTLNLGGLEKDEYYNEILKYARTLDGAEKESDNNPIVCIKAKDVGGKLTIRAVTFNEEYNCDYSDFQNLINAFSPNNNGFKRK